MMTNFFTAPTNLYSMPSDGNRANQKVSVDKTASGTTTMGPLVYRLQASFASFVLRNVSFHRKVHILTFRNFGLLVLKPNQKAVVFSVQ